MAGVILEKTTQKFIDGLAKQGGKPFYKMTPQAARKVLEDLQSSPIEKPAVKIEDQMLPCGPNGKVSVRIVRPQNGNGNRPVIMYFHGGGWILGSKNTHDRLIREIAVGSNANLVFVNFTPAPEAQFPTQ
ncbi:MAG TPA: alpha/beta hydrolase, partial [Chlamydiales bacterium]|nr:alpha/beta hydrolase [Chlamydiales bacterium]